MDDDGQCELDVPLFIELKQSAYQNNDLGAFSTMSIGADQFIGNFKGKIKKSMSQCGDMAYTWAILSSRQVPLFYIDASEPKDSNWLRFIRTTSDVNKYNVICMQQNQQINYFTSKEIKLGEELITYLPAKKKKNRNKNFQNKTYKLVNPVNHIAKIEENSSSSTYSTSSESSSSKKEHENKIQLELINSNISNNNKYVLADFSLIIETKCGLLKSKRRLVKCNLCSFLCSVLITNDSSYLNELKSHYFQNHLSFEPIDIKNEYKINLDDIPAILTDLMNSMLVKIELMNKPLGLKCHNCNQNHFNSEQTLRTHLTSEHSLKFNTLFKCLFCEKEFTKINSFLNHLKSVHKDEIISNKLLWPVATTAEQQLSNQCDFSDLIDFEENLKLDLENFENEDENSVDSSSTVFSSLSSNKQEKNSKQNNDNDEKDEDTMSRSKSSNNNKQTKGQKSNKIENVSLSSQTVAKTWTCQMCKKQFEQRIELSKHQCIELNLKLLKKKKDIRKKKWREAHWKRKIDLSYIETTSLTQLSQNIADNLSFCIDGTNEDLKAYSREVKDYINTEIRNESQMEMFLRCCFSDLQKKLGNSSSSSSQVANHHIDHNLISKANSYFVDSAYQPAKETTAAATTSNKTVHNHNKTNSLVASNSTFNCKSCRTKCRSLPELIQHQRENHKLEFKTTFDCYNHEVEEKNSKNCLNWVSSNMYANSPIGYFSCDPFSYVFNLHWDSTLQISCRNCGRNFARNKYTVHALNCSEQMMEQNSDGEVEESRHQINESYATSSLTSLNQSEIIKNEDSLIIFDEHVLIEQTCSDVMEHLLTLIETDINKNINNNNQLRISSRLHRSNQKKIDDKKYLKEKIILENKIPKSEPIVSTCLKKVDTSSLASNARKLHACNKCGLEFTSANSVQRHQEKSCLRVEVINLKSATSNKSKDVLLSKKKCPICGATFYNTHRVSIHIYKHHRNLLGSAKLPPTNEAKNLNSIQLKKLIKS